MYQGKHTNKVATRGTPKRHRRLRWRKEFVLVYSVLVLLIGVVGGTLAYLTTKTPDVKNTFTAATSGIDIPEKFTDGDSVKEDVKVKNNSDYPVFARATYVYYWADENGNVLAKVPELTAENVNESEWTKYGDYWYCNTVVAANTESPVFIQKMTASPKPGYRLVVDVIAETVQAEPTTAAQEVWGYVPSGN